MMWLQTCLCASCSRGFAACLRNGCSHPLLVCNVVLHLQLDVFYAQFLLHLQPLLSSYVQLLLAAAPNVKKYSGPISLFREIMPIFPADSHRVRADVHAPGLGFTAFTVVFNVCSVRQVT